MNPSTIASLDSEALALRLHLLVGEERNVQVDFVLHLEEFDRRRAYLEGGHASLSDYLLKALHLREGAAWRRIAAMKVLRRFPRVEAALRDGRLCFSTLALLGQVLTEENADELLARAAYRSKAEVDSIVASLKPRPAPAEGVRKLPEPRGAPREPGIEPASGDSAPLVLAVSAAPAPSLGGSPPQASPHEGAERKDVPGSGADPAETGLPPRHDVPAAKIHAVSAGRWSLRVTIDRDLKDDLETLAMMLSHKVPRGDLAAVLREAVRCGIDKHGKRKGAVAPARKRSHPPAAHKSSNSRVIPMEVRREVWKRDGGRCTWTSPNGRHCGSRWQLEFDHILPPLFGGEATVGNLRLRCKAHNLLYAEQVYGREHMDGFRRHQTPNG